MTEFKRSLAVVIGINEYHNGIARLKTAVPDAIAIAEILKESYQYQLVHPNFETGVIVNQYATGERLKKLFIDILPNQIQPTKGDRLVLYFAGHGIARSSDTGPEGYLVPQDGNVNEPDSLLRMGDLHNWLSHLECRHLLVILDCCFAGTFRWASTRKLIPIPEKIHWEHYYRYIKYPAWQVITSAAHNQEALDFLNNRDLYAIKQHSPFAEGLIKALGDRQADLIADGVITTPELYLYLRDYVELNSQEKQTPGFFPLTKHDRGEYIFKLPDLEPQLEPAPKLEKDNNPYRGLESFEERHSHFFFGRQEVIQDLLTKVTHPNQQLTVVLGISGSGKSSLVKAGLIPYLRENEPQKWQILESIRPGNKPFSSLARVLSTLNKQGKTNLEDQVVLLDHNPPNEASRSVTRDTTILGKKLQQNPHQSITAIQTWSQEHPQTRLLLVIDQFEELITLAQPKVNMTEEQKPTWWNKLQAKLFSASKEKTNLVKTQTREEWNYFIDLLAQIIEECPQVSLIITLRSDFEPRFLNSALQSDWVNSRFVVRAMRSDELRDVVEKPATEMALYFEPANLVDRLVDEVSQMPGALPLLSFTLSEMYINLHRAWIEDGKEDRALSVDVDFEQEGGVAGSLTRRANQEYDRLPDRAHQLTMRQVMLRMVEVDGGEAVKRRVLKPELIYPSESENQRVERVLNSLVDTRLIVTGKDTESDSIYYEPAHDFLVRGWDKLQDWLQKGQLQDNLFLQRLLTPAAFEWQEKKKPRDYLWNANPRLGILKQILESEDNWFNQVEKEFVKDSIDLKKLNVTRRWSAAIAVITILSALLIAALLARMQARINQSNASKQSARLNLNSNQSLDAMLDSLRAGTALQDYLLRLSGLNEKLKQPVAKTLQWSVYQVKELNRMQGNVEDTVPVRSIFNPQGDLLASAEENGIIRLWNLKGEELKYWQADPSRVRNVAFSPNQDLLTGAAESGQITLWNLQGEKLADWQGHQGQVRDISFSHDGQLVASAGGKDGTVGLWNLEGKQLQRWRAHRAPIKSVRFSHDNRLIVTTGGDKSIRIWNLQGKLLHEFPVHSWRVIFSPDDRLIASAGDHGYVQIWNRNYQKIASWQADRQRLWNIAFSPDSQAIASAGEDGLAKVWDLEGNQIAEFSKHTGPVRSVSFSQDGKLLASSGDDGTTRLWSLEERELAKWQGDRNSINDLVFSRDGKFLASAGEDGKIRLWDLEGKLLSEFLGHYSLISSISLSPDNQLLAGVSKNGTVHLWNVQGELLQTLPIQINFPETIKFSRDGQLLAIAGANGIIKLWNLQGELVTELSEHQGPVYSLSFSPDGKLLASASGDGTVITWDWESRQVINQFQDHIGEVYTVAFSPNGEWLASGGQDSTIRRWKIEDNSTKSPLHIYRARVNSVTYSPDGKTIFSSDDRGSVRLWDFDSGELLATWTAHKSDIEQISLNSKGNLLATTGQGGAIKIWRIDSFEQLIGQVCYLMQNYLQNNSTVAQSDRSICNDKF